MYTEYVEFNSMNQMGNIFGTLDTHVKLIEKELSVAIMSRDLNVEIKGEQENSVTTAVEVFHILKKMQENGEIINDWAIGQAIEAARDGDGEDAVSAMKDVITITYKGKPIKCKTLGQKGYIKAIKENTVTICIGPAGTGKTYLAMAMAVDALKSNQISRIILTRPAVEAGEKLGFLPGDLQSKVDPYLRPLYDALYEFLGEEKFQKCMERGLIEIAPLAYMRGRTLNDALVLVDESQNASLETLKMVLTRFGEGSKVILTGDITQIDLPKETGSGLKKCADMLKGIDDIAVVYLTNKDVVRHQLVKRIIKAFEEFEEKDKKRSANRTYTRKQ